MKVTIIVDSGPAQITSSHSELLTLEDAKKFVNNALTDFAMRNGIEVGFMLQSIPDGTKIQCIRALREYMDLGLKESKDLIESKYPFVRPKKQEQVYEAARQFTLIGCQVQMKDQKEYEDWLSVHKVLDT